MDSTVHVNGDPFKGLSTIFFPLDIQQPFQGACAQFCLIRLGVTNEKDHHHNSQG